MCFEVVELVRLDLNVAQPVRCVASFERKILAPSAGTICHQSKPVLGYACSGHVMFLTEQTLLSQDRT